MSERNSSNACRKGTTGVGQLSLVEHALCPLDPTVSLQTGAVFHSSYLYTDKSRHTRRANVRVSCPDGLSASDEFYLWGLLALNLSEPAQGAHFMFTPHYCLRRLGLIDQRSRRGGRQYRHFEQAIGRLASVTYQNDAFYDPVRHEHRRVTFGLLSYSLPLDPNSCRAWRFAWDPILFEFVEIAGGYLRFELETYRRLDAASRRLFLLLTKVFWRRETSPVFDLRHLATNVLGFSSTVPTRHLKRKLVRCIHSLAAEDVIAHEGQQQAIVQTGRGTYSVRFRRGPYFQRRAAPRTSPNIEQSPVWEPLSAVGLEKESIVQLTRQYPARLLQEWADITLAALERFGRSFFKRSPQAYFVDGVRSAAAGTRAPPDWWHEVRRAEDQRTAIRSCQQTAYSDTEGGPEPARSAADIVTDILSLFRGVGQEDALARRNAEQFACEQDRRCFSNGHPRPEEPLGKSK